MSTPKTGECRCAKCARLCQRRPGIFAPGEATKAAASLGMTLQAFFREFVTVNYWSDTSDEDYGEVYHLSPAWLTPEVPPLNGRRCSFADGFTMGPCKRVCDQWREPTAQLEIDAAYERETP